MSEEIRTTSATGGQKGTKVERHDLLPRLALDEIARVYAFGAGKYADHNWRRGYEWSKSYAAAQRHLTAWWDGEDLDPESGLSHVGHAGFHIFALLTWIAEQGVGVDNAYDDRWPHGLERARRAAAEPKTYGDVLDQRWREWQEAKAAPLDTEDVDYALAQLRWAADDVETWGADAPAGSRGRTPEQIADDERQARAARKRAALAMEGLAEACLSDDELAHGWVSRDSVLVEEEPTPEPDETASVVEGAQESDEIRQDDAEHPWAMLAGIFDRSFVDMKDAEAIAAGFKVAWKDPEPITLEARDVPLDVIALACGVPVEELMKPPTPPPPAQPIVGEEARVLFGEEARFEAFEPTPLQEYVNAVDEYVRQIAALYAWPLVFVVEADGTITREIG